MRPPRRLTLAEWDARHARLAAEGLIEPWHGGRLGRHCEEGDRRLEHLRFDDSPAALRLWNFLLSEEERLFAARAAGRPIVGAMKDLGTVPVMAFALPELTAFYPDGAWWIPCLMELGDGLLGEAARLGVGEAFCPVRAMLGAFSSGSKFPRPDLLVCAAGATCDDFSGIAQRVERLGHPILWWELPHRRAPEPGEPAVELAGGLVAPAAQVAVVRAELARVAEALGALAGRRLDDGLLADGIAAANRSRRLLAELRGLAYGARPAPLPALEMLVAEMLIIHFCSDRGETERVLAELLEVARARVAAGVGHGTAEDARVYWVNPVADLRAMNLLEECGGRVCGSDYLFTHALDPIDETLEPLEALARAALADPMAGPARERALRICAEMERWGAEAVVVSRIPGASHCATEGELIGRVVGERLGAPVLEVEIPPLSDTLAGQLRGRLQALIETVRPPEH